MLDLKPQALPAGIGIFANLKKLIPKQQEAAWRNLYHAIDVIFLPPLVNVGF